MHYHYLSSSSPLSSSISLSTSSSSTSLLPEFLTSQNPSIQKMCFFREEKILNGALEEITKCLVIWNNLYLIFA